jgi:sugar phosphate isomerase/epimerase
LKDDAKAEAFLKANGLEDGKFLCCIPRLRFTPYWTIPEKKAAKDETKHARNEAMKEHDCKPLRDAIISVIQQTDLKILLCPEDKTQMAVNKEMLYDKLPEDCEGARGVARNYWLTDEAISTYRRSAGLFGHEMHSPIMCIGNGIPAIVCRWAEQTSKGFMWRDIGLGDWLFDLDKEDELAARGRHRARDGERSRKNEADVPRFEKELRLGKEAGAVVFRSWMGGRRYEQFSSVDEFKAYKEGAWRSMQLAEPVARRHRVRLGVENHKDFHAPELVEMLTRLSSEHMGCCIDLGNSVALLEDPLAVVEALSPFVVTTHVKDMAVQEYGDGFLLSEVPLGEGILDLARMFEVIEKANPEVEHHLEMITRDPLEIPCLQQGYWATFPDKPGTELARTLAMVRARKAEKLPKVTGRSTEDALAFEEENIVKCLAYAGASLGFDNLQERKPGDDKDER